MDNFKNEVYDKQGYDKFGYNKDGYNRRGFNGLGVHLNGTMYDTEGYDKEGYDINGFSRSHIHKNGSRFDNDGYNYYGYDFEGFNKEGFNKKGFNKKHIHLNGTLYNDDGYDYKGYNNKGFNSKGYDKCGYDEDGYDKDGYDKRGFDKNGIHRNGTLFDDNGLDINQKYIDGESFEEKEKARYNTFLSIINDIYNNNISIEEYIKKYNLNYVDLIAFSKKEHLNPKIIRSLSSHIKEYNSLIKPFDIDSFLDHIRFLIDGKLVIPKRDDVEKVTKYLRLNNRLVCEKIVSNTVKEYYKGNIDLNKIGNKSELGKQEEISKMLDVQSAKLDELEKSSKKLKKKNI